MIELERPECAPAVLTVGGNRPQWSVSDWTMMSAWVIPELGGPTASQGMSAGPRKPTCPEQGSGMPCMTNQTLALQISRSARPAKSGPPSRPRIASASSRRTSPGISTVHGVVFDFLRRTRARKVASDGLHQYWDECLNSEQVMTMAGITPAAADVSLPCGIGRTSQKHVTADVGPLIAKVPRFGIPVAARCRRMRGSRGIGPLGAS